MYKSAGRFIAKNTGLAKKIVGTCIPPKRHIQPMQPSKKDKTTCVYCQQLIRLSRYERHLRKAHSDQIGGAAKQQVLSDNILVSQKRLQKASCRANHSVFREKSISRPLSSLSSGNPVTKHFDPSAESSFEEIRIIPLKTKSVDISFGSGIH